MRILFLLLLPLTLHAKPGYYEPWGKDSDLKPHEKPAQKKPLSLLAKAGTKAIEFHQSVISPVDGPRSSFRPTSARYTLLAMREHGFIRGFVMGCDRLTRENGDPWHYRTVLIDGVLYKYDPATTKIPPLGSPKK